MRNIKIFEKFKLKKIFQSKGDIIIDELLNDDMNFDKASNIKVEYEYSSYGKITYIKDNIEYAVYRVDKELPTHSYYDYFFKINNIDVYANSNHICQLYLYLEVMYKKYMKEIEKYNL